MSEITAKNTEKTIFSETYLVQLGELTLKGSNIKEFEKRLVHNAQLYLEAVKAHVSLKSGRMYIECPEASCKAVEYTLEHLIGISGWAKAIKCEKDIESIKKAVMQLCIEAKNSGAKTFKIDTRRPDKSFPLSSYEVNCAAAGDVFDQGLLVVDVHNPDLFIRVELREKCYVYGNPKKGHRGLPVGTGGKGLLLLSGGLDSPVAGYRMMRRGMKVECAYFHAYPYTSAEAQQKVEDLAHVLSLYGVETHINIIPFTDVQMRIKEITRTHAPVNGIKADAYSTILLRMCMMKAANLVARFIKCGCLITGESLGQVASQTLENMEVTESCCDFPLLRPLVGMDKEEIVEVSKKIGTYDISILPYEDCCVLFSPEHPVLRARVEDAMELYNALDCEALIQEAFEKREIKMFNARNTIWEMFKE